MLFGTVSKKAMPIMVSALIVSSLSAVIPLIADPMSGDVSIPGRPTAWTPFDRKVESSGVFLPQALSITPDSQSLDSFFQRARRFRYAPDARGGDEWQTPAETERRFSGDCEDKSVWLFARLKEAGFTHVRLVIGKYRMFDPNYHVWVTVTTNGQTYILDAALQNRVWQKELGSSGFYNPFFSFDGETRFRHRGFTN